ncbi:MAG: hypothetical protein JXB38_08605 [Anaerolineales bacterium]|nr:hypothetical protein [Anaerolineales bacterium]
MQPTTKLLILGCLAWLVLAACGGLSNMQAGMATETRARCAPLGDPPTAADIQTEAGWTVVEEGTATCHWTGGDDRAAFYFDQRTETWKGAFDRGPDGDWDFTGFFPEHGTAGAVDLAAGTFSLSGPLEDQGLFPGMGVPSCALDGNQQP